MIQTSESNHPQHTSHYLILEDNKSPITLNLHNKTYHNDYLTFIYQFQQKSHLYLEQINIQFFDFYYFSDNLKEMITAEHVPYEIEANGTMIIKEQLTEKLVLSLKILVNVEKECVGSIVVKKEEETFDIPENENIRNDFLYYLHSNNLETILFEGLTKYWDPQALDKVMVSKVGVDSVEYKIIEESFLVDMSQYDTKLLGIERIQNIELMKWYITMYIEMMKKLNQSSEKRICNIEKKLYHGTEKELIPSIVNEGIDVRLAKKSGSIGMGGYFAKSPITSLNYVTLKEEEKKIILCRVLVGKNNLKGKPRLRRPPYIPGTIDLGDSVYGDLGHDKIYAIFDRYQIYPEYIITFKLDDSKIINMKKTLNIPSNLNNSGQNQNIDD